MSAEVVAFVKADLKLLEYGLYCELETILYPKSPSRSFQIAPDQYKTPMIP